MNKDNKWDIKDNISTYEKLIWADSIKDYRVTDVILTTYGLDMTALTNMLIAIDCLGVVDKVHVYYDMLSLVKDAGNNVIPEENLHGINIYQEDNGVGRKYAFHPKLILLRYEKMDSQEIRYVIAVMSKNITNSNLLDVFCVAYGDVADNCGTASYKRNGGKISGFIEKLAGLSSGCNHHKLCQELEYVNFKCEDSMVKSLEFISQEGIKGKIDDMKDLIVISPFVSDAFFRRYKEKLACVVSTSEGYGQLDRTLIEELNSKDGPKNGFEKRCFIFDEGDSDDHEVAGLHGKIYCGRIADNRVRLIVGSSNATSNGCGLNHKGQNVEVNAVMEFMDDDIYIELDQVVKAYGIAVENVDDNDEEIRNADEELVVSRFLKNNLQSIIAVRKAEKWELKFRVSLIGDESEIIVSNYQDKEWEPINRDGLTISLNEPEDMLFIKLQNGENTKCFRITPYMNLEEGDNRDYLEMLNNRNKDNLKEVIDYQVRRILRGSVRKKYIDKKEKVEINENPSNHTLRYPSKKYIYEELKELAWITKKENPRDLDAYKLAYISKLKRLKEYAAQVKSADIYYYDMYNAIEKLLSKG